MTPYIPSQLPIIELLLLRLRLVVVLFRTLCSLSSIRLDQSRSQLSSFGPMRFFDFASAFECYIIYQLPTITIRESWLCDCYRYSELEYVRSPAPKGVYKTKRLGSGQ